jgi:hypothetical protein
VGFEPTISAGERPKTYALDGAATGTGIHIGVTFPKNNFKKLKMKYNALKVKNYVQCIERKLI